MYSKIPLIAALLAVLVSCQQTDFEPAAYVNPFIGATTSVEAAGYYHGLGKTFPGATTPFGMVQTNPTTVTGGDNASGYSDEMKTIEGFALTQMSGTGWYGEFGNFLTMPTTGELQTIAGLEDGSIDGWRSFYDKETETAEAGYYSVMLTDYGIKAELTAAPHSGIMKFTFPKNELSRIQIDLARRVAGTSETEYLKVLDDNTITGWMRCTPDCGGWGDGAGQANYTFYFYAKFSKSIANHGFWSADIPDGWSRHRDDVVSLPYLSRVKEAEIIRGADEMEGKHIGFFAEFPTEENEEITLSVGISFVDMEGARNNFEKEIAGKSFCEVRKEAWDQWNDALSVINVKGGTEEDKIIFYTSLYHSFIDPRTYTDVDGRYTGADGLIHSTNGEFTKRTIFSGWDIYRSQMPLQTIIHPEVVSDLINSLTTMASESGRKYYERWEIVNSYSGCMNGNPALSVIADAYAKGIRTFDAPLALEYCKNTSDIIGNGPLGYTPGGSCLSTTLETGYADWCASQFAEALGNDEYAAILAERGQAYRNIFSDEAGWFRVRNEDGSWAPWDENSKTQEGYGCFECGPFQQGWFVPHDIDGLQELIGGHEKTMENLHEFFDKTPLDFSWNNYYNHANEPVHLVPFLFNKLGEPWNTQKWTRIICDNAYYNAVEGICGNEDCGQMSAWYILSASGIHPSCPGETRMEITSPVFDRIEFNLNPEYATGEKFTVIAHNNSSKNVYIQKARLNGKELNACHIDFSDIAAGGTLELYMGPEANENWGIE